MPKILINELKQEISSFNPHLGQYRDFLIARGEGVLAAHRGLRSEVAGAVAV